LHVSASLIDVLLLMYKLLSEWSADSWRSRHIDSGS